MRLSNKIVGLDLTPFSKMVENHCCRSNKNVGNFSGGLEAIAPVAPPPLIWPWFGNERNRCEPVANGHISICSMVGAGEFSGVIVPMVDPIPWPCLLLAMHVVAPSRYLLSLSQMSTSLMP